MWTVLVLLAGLEPSVVRVEAIEEGMTSAIETADQTRRFRHVEAVEGLSLCGCRLGASSP